MTRDADTAVKFQTSTQVNVDELSKVEQEATKPLNFSKTVDECRSAEQRAQFAADRVVAPSKGQFRHTGSTFHTGMTNRMNRTVRAGRLHKLRGMNLYVVMPAASIHYRLTA